MGLACNGSNDPHCLRRAFRGRDMTSTICSSVSSCSWVVTGKRPTNSGKKPKLIKSSTCTGTAEPPDDSEGLLRGEVFWTTAPARDEASLDGLPIVALKPMCVVLARRRLSITDCQGRGNARQRGRDGEHRRFQGVSHDGANTGMG